MKRTKTHSFISISPRLYLYLALLLLILPARWIIACICAATIHELGHIIAIKLLGLELHQIRIDVGGAVIETNCVNAAQELICAISGPAAGLLPLLLIRQFPAVAVCALLQTTYNLVPVVPLDGGRVMQCAFSMLLPECAAKRAAECISVVSFGIIFAVAVILTIKQIAGLIPFVVFALIAVKYMQQKNSLQR